MTITDQTTGVDLVQTPSTDLVPSTGGRRERRLAAGVGRSTGPTRSSASSEVDEGEKQPRAPMTPGRGIVTWVFATVCLLSLWFVIYAVLLTPFQENHQQVTLYSQLREDLAQQTAPLGGEIAPGTPVTLLTARSIGVVDNVVVEGTASGDLMSGPGHKRDTVLPGQAGVSVVYGRAGLFGGPFGALASAKPGDEITAITGQGTFIYVVTGLRRAGDPFPAPLAQGGSRLTLVSADSHGRFGALHPEGTLYVDAILTGQSQPSPPGKPVAVPKSEQAMQGDPNAFLPLALALPLLIGAVIVAVWARNRWGGWQTWLVGVPLVLAALWAVSQAAVQLLPNLL
jgi:sortase A